VLIFLYFEGWLSSKREREENGKNQETVVIEVLALNPYKNIFIS